MINVLHGVCLQKKPNFGKEKFLNILIKLICKTPNKALVETMGSVILNKDMKPERIATHAAFTGKMYIY